METIHSNRQKKNLSLKNVLFMGVCVLYNPRSHRLMAQLEGSHLHRITSHEHIIGQSVLEFCQGFLRNISDTVASSNLKSLLISHCVNQALMSAYK